MSPRNRPSAKPSHENILASAVAAARRLLGRDGILTLDQAHDAGYFLPSEYAPGLNVKPCQARAILGSDKRFESVRIAGKGNRVAYRMKR